MIAEVNEYVTFLAVSDFKPSLEAAEAEHYIHRKLTMMAEVNEYVTSLAVSDFYLPKPYPILEAAGT